MVHLSCWGDDRCVEGSSNDDDDDESEEEKEEEGQRDGFNDIICNRE